MEFIARTRELARFERFLNAPGQSVALVYGRRRVGKSELIKQALHGFGGVAIYYECKQTTEMNNVESLATLVSEAWSFPPLSFRSIEEVLGFLFQRSVESGVALVLDEYPYLRDAVRGLDSILQSLIDANASTSQLKLVVCGSYMDVMRSMLLEQSPLYGRVDMTLRLDPMDYYDSSLFYPGFSNEDKVRLYSVFGGIPYYNRLVDQGSTVRENVIALVTSPDARLQGEVDLHLRSELGKLANANAVFEALAQGYSKYKDILAQSHVSSGPTLVDVLARLQDMGLVEKEVPINARDNRRKTGYRIADPLTRFYYRYVSRYLSQMQVMDEDVFFDRYVARDFEESFVPHAFEEVCRQYLVRQNRIGALPETFDLIGSYAYDDPNTRTSGEFDVVTQDSEGYVFYECKFRRSPIDQRMVDEEIAQVAATRMRCHAYGFFSRAGFSVSDSECLRLIDLHALYAVS